MILITTEIDSNGLQQKNNVIKLFEDRLSLSIHNNNKKHSTIKFFFHFLRKPLLMFNIVFPSQSKCKSNIIALLPISYSCVGFELLINLKTKSFIRKLISGQTCQYPPT